MSKAWTKWAASVAIAVAAPTMFASAPAGAAGAATVPGYVMPATQAWDMTSDGGKTYRIFASFPKGEAPKGGYPVLYVLDGNASFASFAETRRLLEYSELKSIVVGVGYPTDEAYDQGRNADYIYPLHYPGAPKDMGDGREKFLDFLTGKLRAEIGRRFRIDPERQSLFGHSFGGLLALHTLYTRPGAFQSIVAASPSLIWNTQEMLREERDFAAKLAGGQTVKMSRLMVVVGGRDTDDDPEPARALTARLDPLSAYGLSTRFRRYEEETHMTVPIRAVADVFRFVQ